MVKIKMKIASKPRMIRIVEAILGMKKKGPSKKGLNFAQGSHLWWRLEIQTLWTQEQSEGVLPL